MSNISMVEAKLPPGFRFHPRDEELVSDYLLNKINNTDSLLLIEVDLNKCEPWDIPEMACVGGKEWYFYSRRDRKYATGIRTNRATASGYWKATGKDRSVLRKGSSSVVGMRKTLVFYKGRAPKGKKTDWVMHEFRLEPPLSPSLVSPIKEDWVLCRVFYKKREEIERPNGMSCYEYDDKSSASSSLPPLMDSYITFDQTQPPNNLLSLSHSNQQVPCFSIFSQAQAQAQNQTSLLFPHIYEFDPSNNQSSTTSSFPQLPATTTPCPNFENNDFSSDKKVIKAFLNQLTNMDSSSSNHNNNINYESQSPTSESYLSEAAMSNMWTNHGY